MVSTIPPLDPADTEKRKENRRAANRRSAKKSRYREMVMLEELQRNSIEWGEKNLALKEENKALRALMSELMKLKESNGSDLNNMTQDVDTNNSLAPVPESIANGKNAIDSESADREAGNHGTSALFPNPSYGSSAEAGTPSTLPTYNHYGFPSSLGGLILGENPESREMILQSLARGLEGAPGFVQVPTFSNPRLLLNPLGLSLIPDVSSTSADLGGAYMPSSYSIPADPAPSSSISLFNTLSAVSVPSAGTSPFSPLLGTGQQDAGDFGLYSRLYRGF